ncbi:MAG TPA: MASE1 domain-containing protein [Ktedonobacteraceae bacterium]|nr:MASE1 domain-containing protein [Ktedonobacteraceae bacterium]
MKFPLFLPQRKWGYVLYVGKVFLIAAIYFSTARFGLSLDAVSGFATLVWLPSGIALAAGLLFGYRLWPGIFIGAFLANLLNGAPIFVAIGIGIGNTLEPMVGTYLLKSNRFSSKLNQLSDVLLLVLLAMPLSALISATVGVSSLLLGKVIIFSAFFTTWSAWWIGDMISILILTPFLLIWSKLSYETVAVKRYVEIGLLTISLLLTGLVVFLGLFHTNRGGFPRTYLVFPPLIWTTLRFGQRGTLTALLGLSILAIIGTIQGLSPFSGGNPGISLIALQSFMGVTAITSMILAAEVEERKELERRKDDFISMASHELKTPLTSLLGYTELLHRKAAEPGSQEAQRYLAKMTAQIEKLSRLIADLLDISKIQAGKIVYAEEAVDVDELVREVVETLQQSNSKHHISIEGRAQREVVGDRERLEQVLINLISNAIKYSPQAEKVIVRLTHLSNSLTISVQDFGIGIPMTHQKKVFERFYRVYNDKDRTYPGLGIGLYIAYQIIEQHHGKMWVESVEEQGSTFSFSLPLRN